MKKIIIFAISLVILCVMHISCIKIGTYTKVYQVDLKLDGVENAQISVEYVGPRKLNDLAINGKVITPLSIQKFHQHDSSKPVFSGDNNQFYKIKNTTSEDLYVFYMVHSGNLAEDGTDYKKDKYYRSYLNELFFTYEKEDKDKTFVADEEIQVLADKKEKYISRYDLYTDLIRLNYPYIKKLAPGEEYTLRWGLKW